jgi:NolX protein
MRGDGGPDPVAAGLARALDALARDMPSGAPAGGAWGGSAASAFAERSARIGTDLAATRAAFAQAAAALDDWSRQAAASDVVAALEAATASLPQPDARPAAGGVLSWLDEHLDDVGNVAGVVSGAAGALAFVPVLTPVMAPVALASGAVALAADVADATVHERWETPRSIADVGLDVAGLVPGVRFATGAAAAVREAAYAGSAVHVLDGPLPGVVAGVTTFARGEAAAAGAYREPGVWAVATGAKLAQATGVDPVLAARGFELQARIGRAVSRARRTGDQEASPPG